METESRSVFLGVVGVGGPKEEGLAGMMQMFWNLMVVQHYGNAECRWAVRFKIINFKVCVFYHNKKRKKKDQMR